MKSIVIYGAGGFGREVQWLIERINQQEEEWLIEGYLDDGVEPGTRINGYTVLGGIEKLRDYDRSLSIVCTVRTSAVREKIIRKIEDIGIFEFPNLIDPDVKMSDSIRLGKGNIICAGSILTVNISIKDFVILNLNATVGHDAVLKSYATVYPGVNISGCVSVAEGVELGTGTQIIQGKEIGKNTIVGEGSVVIRDLPPDCTAVGVPAKIVKYLRERVKKLLILGRSGHGKVIEDIAFQTGYYNDVFFLDDDTILQETDGRVLGNSSFAIAHKEEYDVIVGIGNARIRRRMQETYEEAGVNVVSLIHPSSCIAEDVFIGKGTVIMAGTVVQAGSSIGKGVIVNTSSSIDHECTIGDYTHVSVGSHLAGNVTIGEGSWVGAGAVISNNICVYSHVTLGAGTVVVRNITESGIYVGIPAKKIR